MVCTSGPLGVSGQLCPSAPFLSLDWMGAGSLSVVMLWKMPGCGTERRVHTGASEEMGSLGRGTPLHTPYSSSVPLESGGIVSWGTWCVGQLYGCLTLQPPHNWQPPTFKYTDIEGFEGTCGREESHCLPRMSIHIYTNFNNTLVQHISTTLHFTIQHTTMDFIQHNTRSTSMWIGVGGHSFLCWGENLGILLWPIAAWPSGVAMVGPCTILQGIRVYDLYRGDLEAAIYPALITTAYLQAHQILVLTRACHLVYLASHTSLRMRMLPSGV